MRAGTRTATRKTVTRLVVSTVTLLLLLSTVPAASAGNQMFPDVGGHWAERAIVKMALKGIVQGYDDGTFRPNTHVNRLQTIVMVVRALGRDQEARQRTTIPASFLNPEFVPAWGVGYVAIAVEEGIIAGNDLTNFRSNDPATRLEVSVFMARMLGRGEEAAERAGSNLPFSDVGEIPSSLRGYVLIVYEEGLIRGNPDGTFRPSAAITRAELATLMSRADDTIPGIMDGTEIRGTLASVTLGAAATVSVRRNNEVTAYQVADGAHVYFHGDKSTLSNLIVGDDVVVIRNELGRAVFIETGPRTETVSGTIMSVSVSGNSFQIARRDGQTETIYVSSEARIQLDGRTVSLSGLAAGQQVTVTRKDGTVTNVTVTAPVTTVTGVVVGYIPGPPPLITVRVEGENKTFQVVADASIKRDGATAVLTDLRTGDGVSMQVQADTALSINAMTMDRNLAGTLNEVKFVSPPTVTIDTSTGSFTYPVADDAVIRRQARTSTLTALRKGDDVTVEIRGGKVTRLEAEPVTRTVSGTVQAVYIAATPTITIKTLAGDEATYVVAANALIRMGRTGISLSEIKPGYLVELRLESNEVVRIDVEAVELLEDLKGTIEYVVDAARVIVISVEDPNEVTRTREIHVDSRTYIFRDNRLTDLDALEVGDRVLVVGSMSTGIFKASVIIVTTIGY